MNKELKRGLLPVLLAILITGILTACGNDDAESYLTNQEVIDAFQNAGLEVEDASEMTKDDYGIAPMKAEEGTRFLIPSLGDDAGGRVFTYDNESDLDEMQEHYDSMGKESAMLFSWTIKYKNVLVQINGDLSEEEYNEYKKALESL